MFPMYMVPVVSSSLHLCCCTQILTVVRHRSAAGLSPLSFELEAYGLMIHTLYGALAGLPFSAYG
jgi:uncharacterized protein with PQ loop repeat